MDGLLIKILLSGVGLLLALMLLNLYISNKTKAPSQLLMRLSYILGIVLVLINAARMLSVSYTMVAANIIVIFSIALSWRKSEKGENRDTPDQK